MKEQQFAELSVPSLIMTPTDVSRLRREIVTLDNYMEQEVLRAPGHPQQRLPKTSRLLDQLAQANNVNLLDANTRKYLSEFLADVATNAPVVHVSFASDPSSAFLQKIVLWFRDNVHPSILVRVGLQPTLAAGCTVQTTNRYFDMSLRQHLERNKGMLVELLKVEKQP